jgi:hypothetical protein
VANADANGTETIFQRQIHEVHFHAASTMTKKGSGASTESMTGEYASAC